MVNERNPCDPPEQLGLSVGGVGGTRTSYAVVLMEQSARAGMRNPHAVPSCGTLRRRPMVGPCVHTPPRARTPATGPPATRVMWRPAYFFLPARPRGYAVGGRRPCTPNPGRWTYQRTATPTGFPATLTRRRWRLTYPGAHRIIPPPARVPPFGSCVEMMCAARHSPTRLLGVLSEPTAPPQVAPR